MCSDSSPLAFTNVITDPINEVNATVDDAVNDYIPGGWGTVAAVAGAVAAPYLAPSLFAGLGAAEAGAVAGDAFLPGALATTADVAPGIAADVAANAGSAGMASLGSGTALSADALTNPLNPFYGTSAGSNPLLTSAGYGASDLGGAGSIIGSGTGLGQATLGGTIASAAPMLDGLTAEQLASNNPLYSNSNPSLSDINNVRKGINTVKSLTNLSQNQQQPNQQQPNQQLANGLRGYQMPSIDAPVYKQQNPFTFAPQADINGNRLAKLLKEQ